MKFFIGWYHTGDAGHYDEDGDFYITERLKDLIKYRLHHVAPAAIENVIQEHPEIVEVGVVAKPDNNDLEQPLAFVTRRIGSKVSLYKVITRYLRNILRHKTEPCLFPGDRGRYQGLSC